MNIPDLLFDVDPILTSSKASMPVADLFTGDNKEAYKKSLSQNIGYTNIEIDSGIRINIYCECFDDYESYSSKRCETRNINNLVFDFSKYFLKIDECKNFNCSFCHSLKTNEEGYSVNIEDINLKSFSHASCQCGGKYTNTITNSKFKYINNVHINNIHIVLDYRHNHINVTTHYDTVIAF